MKMTIVKCGLAILLMLMLCLAVWVVRDYADRRRCVCSMLTAEEQTFPIDDRLYRICEKDTMRSGVFMVMQTTCEHGKFLRLTVMPDEGIFRGYIPAR